MVEELGAFAPAAWVHARGVMSLARPRVMAIVNVTPDSFSDGGRFLRAEDREPDVDAIAAIAAQLQAEGADILDIGGESTRPGAAPVDPEAEIARVLPVIERLRGLDVPLSIDTRRASVARAAVEAGAAIINDVSGLADPEMAEVAARSGAGLVVGHMRGVPATMQQGIRFGDLLREVTDELAAAVERAVEAGVERPRIVVDPGIGFGKTAEQSAALVAAAGWLRQATRCPVLVGASRKSFLSAIVGGGPHDRLPGSLAAALVAVERGASVLRVHDVVETVHALAVARSIRAAYDAAEARARSGGDLH
jgi:dihydropteroate synthase